MPINKYILVKGDISGIQEFIFNVKSKGAAASLKGRSFFIKILTEITIQYLFDKFNVAENKRNELKISTSGGNFYLRLPISDNWEDQMNELQINLSICLRYSGINISIHAVELEEMNYKKCLIELNQKVRENKLRLYSTDDELEFKTVFEPTDKNDFTLIDGNTLNNQYSKWKSLTSEIRTNKYFSIINSTFQNKLIINEKSIELLGYKCVFHIDDAKTRKIQLSNYLESIFPYYKGNLRDFEDLAHYGNGDKKLGILKMDVDNLGTAIENIISIEEHKQFDNLLRNFFNNELSSLINNSFTNEIYTVTAGGDDSFFLGHWKNTLELAIYINNLFSNQPLFNKLGLTISAGYIIVDPKFPVIRFAQLAEEALHKAKYEYEKGNICIFNEVISWNKFEQVLRFKKKISDNIDKKSKGLLAKARQSAIKGIEEDIINLKENWEIAYYMRDVKDKSLLKEITKFIKKSVELKGNTKKLQQEKRNLRIILPVAARLTELEKR